MVREGGRASDGATPKSLQCTDVEKEGGKEEARERPSEIPQRKGGEVHNLHVGSLGEVGRRACEGVSVGREREKRRRRERRETETGTEKAAAAAAAAAAAVAAAAAAGVVVVVPPNW